MLHAVPLTSPHLFTDGIEGPACDREGNLYAVNYERQGTIGKVLPSGEGSVFLTLPEGSIGSGIRFHHDGRMFIADYVGHNIVQVEMESRAISIYAHEPSLHQPNDLAISATGVLYASDPDWATETGRIWRVGEDRRFILLADDMGTTNGIEISPDERTLYVNETVQQRVWAFDLNARGDLSNRRLLYTFNEDLLDGMRCDMAGNLYIARYGHGTIAKISPQGELLTEIALAGKDCTNITFGGADGCTCYVTVADTGQIETFRVDVPGRLTPP
jgi:sugar lactone lactonase YvrE